MISCTSGWRTTSRSVKAMKRMPGMPRRMAAAAFGPDAFPAGRRTDLHDVRVWPIGDVPAVGPPRLPTRRRARAPVRDSTERPHEEDYVVPELRGGSAELYPATSTVLHYGSSVRVQESLEDCQSHVRRVEEILRRDKLRVRADAAAVSENVVHSRLVCDLDSLE